MMSDFQLTPPDLPSLRRYRALFPFRSQLSLLRALEYEQLAKLDFRGRVLDFGGGDLANYHRERNSWMAAAQYESVNINPEMAPSYLIRPDDPLPVASGSIDMVLTLNTLEHVFAIEATLAEFSRVLRPQGRLVATVPFLFRVHAHPEDYLRATPSWWGRMLRHHGFAKIKILPLLWGAFSTGAMVSGLPGPGKRLRYHAALLLDILYAKLQFHGARYEGAAAAGLLNAPLGWFITARRAAAASAAPSGGAMTGEHQP